MKKLFLTEKEVSKLTSLALPTLRNHRYLGRGFPYVKIGGAVRYAKADIIRFIEARKITTKDSGKMSAQTEFLGKILAWRIMLINLQAGGWLIPLVK